MTEPFLILHKVRGQPAFDIAIRMKCPLCADGVRDCDEVMCDCGECEGLGYWWIIPTSGHRAYPFETHELFRFNFTTPILEGNDGWDALPDHCQHSIDRKALSDSSPIRSPELQLVLQGLIKPQAPIVRRKL
jgi:hypothetical protein